MRAQAVPPRSTPSQSARVGQLLRRRRRRPTDQRRPHQLRIRRSDRPARPRAAHRPSVIGPSSWPPATGRLAGRRRASCPSRPGPGVQPVHWTRRAPLPRGTRAQAVRRSDFEQLLERQLETGHRRRGERVPTLELQRHIERIEVRLRATVDEHGLRAVVDEPQLGEAGPLVDEPLGADVGGSPKPTVRWTCTGTRPASATRTSGA